MFLDIVPPTTQPNCSINFIVICYISLFHQRFNPVVPSILLLLGAWSLLLFVSLAIVPPTIQSYCSTDFIAIRHILLSHCSTNDTTPIFLLLHRFHCYLPRFIVPLSHQRFNPNITNDSTPFFFFGRLSSVSPTLLHQQPNPVLWRQYITIFHPIWTLSRVHVVAGSRVRTHFKLGNVRFPQRY